MEKAILKKVEENKVTFEQDGKEKVIIMEDGVASFALKHLKEEVEYDCNPNGKVRYVKGFSQSNAKPTTNSKSRYDEVNFGTLLNDAHAKFKDGFKIETEILKDGNGKLLLSYTKKQCICKARVTVFGCIRNKLEMGDLKTEEIVPGNDSVFEGIGDAENIKSTEVQKGFIRMAETRSIVKALKLATNNAKVAAEELGDKGPEKKK